jgi:hypothetical protein
MVFPRLSRTTTGSHTHSISNPMEAQPISDVLLPTQDGGKSSDTKEDILSTKKERLSKFKIRKKTLMLRTETSK